MAMVPNWCSLAPFWQQFKGRTEGTDLGVEEKLLQVDNR